MDQYIKKGVDFMNNKQMYEKIIKIINGDKNTPQILEEIKKELETEILLNGKKANNSIKQAFKRLQKENEIRPRFKNVLRTQEKTYTITDGYFLITYTAEQLPTELKPHIESENNEPIEMYYNRLKNTDETRLLNLNYEALKKMYKYNKLNKLRNIFTLQNGYTFNLQYFMDIMAFLNYKDISQMQISISEKLIAPMNIETPNGNAILLPIRMDTEDIENQLKLQNEVITN